MTTHIGRSLLHRLNNSEPTDREFVTVSGHQFQFFNLQIAMFHCSKQIVSRKQN